MWQPGRYGRQVKGQDAAVAISIVRREPHGEITTTDTGSPLPSPQGERTLEGRVHDLGATTDPDSGFRAFCPFLISDTLFDLAVVNTEKLVCPGRHIHKVRLPF